MNTEKAMRLAKSDFYSLTQVMIKLGVARATIYKLAKSGKLPGVVRLGKMFRVRKAVLDAFIDGG